MDILQMTGEGAFAFFAALITNPDFINFAVAAIVVPLIVRGFKRFGVEIDAQQAQSLHSAIGRAVDAAFQANPKASKQEVVSAAAAYVQKHNPGTLKHFKLDTDALTDLITPHLPFPFNAIASTVGKAIDGD